MWTDFGFYFNASSEFFAKEFKTNNKHLLQPLFDKFGAYDFEEYVKNIKTEYEQKTNKEFTVGSEQYKIRRNFLENKISNYCISNGLGQSKFIPMVEKELDREFLNSKNLDFHYNRLVENFSTYLKNEECRTLLKEFNSSIEKHVKENYHRTFVQKGLSVPGTVILVKNNNDDETEFKYLIGDVNPTGSFVNDKKHMYISDTSIVLKYKKIEY